MNSPDQLWVSVRLSFKSGPSGISGQREFRLDGGVLVEPNSLFKKVELGRKEELDKEVSIKLSIARE
jgi:hypothetical protein